MDLHFGIIDSTLREGEQFAKADFCWEEKLAIARGLDEVGVEYLELTTPVASKQSEEDLIKMCKQGLRAKILTHVRCTKEDVDKALGSGVHGVNLLFGTSQLLREHSHGKTLKQIMGQACEAVQRVLSAGLEVRFSTEDTFRTNREELLEIYTAIDALGVHRIGIADTVGVATPSQVYSLVQYLRPHLRAEIEFHGHNDTGSAVANSLSAIEAGARWVDTCVLGIGERNGITALGGFLARMYSLIPEYVENTYEVHKIQELDQFVAHCIQEQIPFNEVISGKYAFTHKAGIHLKAVINQPSTYEIFNPQVFGRQRSLLVGHRLTGWNAIWHVATEAGLDFHVDQIKQITQEIKEIAKGKSLSRQEVLEYLQRSKKIKNLADSKSASARSQ